MRAPVKYYLYPGAIAAGLTLAAELVFGRKNGLVIAVICAILVLLFYPRYRYYRFHRCMRCQRIIWPWQTWIYASVTEGKHGHYHNTMRRKCFEQAMRAAGYMGLAN